jgi:acyl carrier protein
MEQALEQDQQEQTTKIRELMVDYLVNQGGIAADVVANGSVKVEDLGVDSLSMVEMLYEIEDKYGIRVENLTVLKDMTIDSMVEFLNSLANKNKVAA